MSETLSAKQRGFVYRCWDADKNCLYIGQHTGFHPATRINDHRSKRWWPDVAEFDYIEVEDLDQLSETEFQQIQLYQPKYNRLRTRRESNRDPVIKPKIRANRSFTVSDDEWESFVCAVKEADSQVSASHALRELMRWYAGGCGGRLRLTIPVVFPSSDQAGTLHPRV